MAAVDDECVRVWFSQLKNEVALSVFQRFFGWLQKNDEFFRGFSPSGLADWQSNATGRERYRILTKLYEFIDDVQPPLRYSSKQSYKSHVASFFNYNRAPFPQDSTFHFKSEVPPVEGNLTVEAFRRILHNSNKMYRAVFLMMGQTLMGCNELVYVSNNLWHEVLDALTKNVGLFKLPLPGRKKNRNVKNFYTILCTRSDWADAMRDYLKSSAFELGDCLFRNENGNPLTKADTGYYFHARAVEAGVIKQMTPNCERCNGETVRALMEYKEEKRKIGYKCKRCGNVLWACEVKVSFTNIRYGVNQHEIRDLMRSRWRESGAKTIVAEFMMQHGEQIDPNEYDKMKYTPTEPFIQYMKALPWLNVLSNEPNRIDRSTVDAELEAQKEEIQILKKELATRRVDPEKLQFIEKIGELIKEPEVAESFKQWLKDLPKK